jgi:phage tail tape-measure protein
MRKSLLAAVAMVALMAPAAVNAQEAAAGAATGAAAGAITGAVVGGPVGAAVGAGVGGTMGAAAGDASQRNKEGVIIEERAPSVTERTCVEGATSTQCVETKR